MVDFPCCFGCSFAPRYTNNHTRNRESQEGFNIHTLALALSYALVHAAAKSGTSAGLSTGGGSLSKAAGYTPGMGGSEDGDGNGAKRYGEMGMVDGPGSVSTLILVVVGSIDGGELILPEEDELARLDGDEDNDIPELVDDKGKGNGKEAEDKVESEGAAEAHAATRRMRTAEDRMDVQWGAVD